MADVIIPSGSSDSGGWAVALLLAVLIIGGVTWANWGNWYPMGPSNTEINVTTPAPPAPERTEIKLEVPKDEPDTNIIVPPKEEPDTNIIIEDENDSP